MHAHIHTEQYIMNEICMSYVCTQSLRTTTQLYTQNSMLMQCSPVQSSAVVVTYFTEDHAGVVAEATDKG